MRTWGSFVPQVHFVTIQEGYRPVPQVLVLATTGGREGDASNQLPNVQRVA